MSERDDILEQLSAWLDGELSDEQSRRIEQAVRNDPDLQAELESLRAVRRLVRGLGGRKAPEGFASRVLARAERAHLLGQPAPMVSRSFRWISLATAAVVLLAVGAVLYMIVYMAKPPEASPLAANPANNKPEPAPPSALRDSVDKKNVHSPTPPGLVGKRRETAGGEKVAETASPAAPTRAPAPAPPAAAPITPAAPAVPVAPPVVAIAPPPPAGGAGKAGPEATGVREPERLKEAEEPAKALAMAEDARPTFEPPLSSGGGGAGMVAKPMAKAKDAPAPAPPAPAPTAKEAGPGPAIAMKTAKPDGELLARRSLPKGSGEFVESNRVLLRTGDLVDGRRSVEAILVRNGLSAGRTSGQAKNGLFDEETSGNVYYAKEADGQVQITAHLSPQQVRQVRNELDSLQIAWGRTVDRLDARKLTVADAAPVTDDRTNRGQATLAPGYSGKLAAGQPMTAPAAVVAIAPPTAEAPDDGATDPRQDRPTTAPKQQTDFSRTRIALESASGRGMTMRMSPSSQAAQVQSARAEKDLLEKKDSATTQPRQAVESVMAQAGQLREVQQMAAQAAPYATRPAMRLPGEMLQVQQAATALEPLVITLTLHKPPKDADATVKAEAATTAPADLPKAARQAAPDAAQKK